MPKGLFLESVDNTLYKGEIMDIYEVIGMLMVIVAFIIVGFVGYGIVYLSAYFSSRKKKPTVVLPPLRGEHTPIMQEPLERSNLSNSWDFNKLSDWRDGIGK